MLGFFSVHYVIKVVLQIATRFTTNNNYYTMPHKQELIKEGLVLRPASFRGQGKNSVEGSSGPGLYSRKYMCSTFLCQIQLTIISLSDHMCTRLLTLTGQQHYALSIMPHLTAIFSGESPSLFLVHKTFLTRSNFR